MYDLGYLGVIVMLALPCMESYHKSMMIKSVCVCVLSQPGVCLWKLSGAPFACVFRRVCE